MNTLKETILPEITMGYVDDPSRPVIAYRADVSHARCREPHAHPRAQVIFAISGTMRVQTERNIWFIPPTQSVWIPPDVRHQVSFPDAVSLCNLFVEPLLAAGLPKSCIVFNVSPLLRELMRKAGYIGESYGADGPEYRIMQVIIDELELIEPAKLNLPLGSDHRLMKVIGTMLDKPEDTRTLSEWSDMAGASGRTLARLFLSETGMTFGQWRTRLRLLIATEKLSQGASVGNVAFELGYLNTSAFIEAFRQVHGETPGHFSKRTR